MVESARVRVYIACSFDGFIAGPGDDLSWLPGADPARGEQTAPCPPDDPGAVQYEQFMAEVGVLLMGRRTYDAVLGFGIDWPYGDRTVLVATHRPLQSPIPTVRPVCGPINHMIRTARRAAGTRDVYLDGGQLVRQALDAELIDDLIVTLVPELLGSGQPLFSGLRQRHSLDFTGMFRFGRTMFQVHARPRAAS